MKHPRVLELNDTKITIEIEAVRQSDEFIEQNLKELEESGAEGVLFPYSLVTRLKIGDRQIGLVQGLLLMARADSVRPQMALDLGGPREEMSPALKESLDLTAAQLSQFPFINWAISGVPGGKFTSEPVVVGRSVEELATQLVADLQGQKDWHDRVINEAENTTKTG